jgi:hypothetical protein
MPRGVYKRESSAEDRFWSYVNKTHTCWLWTGNKDKNGYGKIYFLNKHMRSHRLSYKLFNGNFDEKLLVLHSCDNPSCVRPDHLFLGTNKDNMKDKVNKNRQAKGNSCGKSFLTEKQVLDIKEQLKNYQRGMYTSLSKEYKVRKSTIISIANGRTWKHI